MFAGKRILSLIPARGGSKGIKNKNITSLRGKPLISYTINASLNSSCIDRTVVTTDSEEIAEAAKRYGADVPFLRPADLASDAAKTIDAVLHAVRELENLGDFYDVLVLLQPTEPLRTEEDIDGAVSLFFEKGLRGLASVSLPDDHPILMRMLDDNGELSSLLGLNSTCRRQDMPAYYKVNGCIYINRIDEISEKTSFNDNPIGYIMEPSHSVDIDEPKDLVLADYYLEQKKSRK